MLVRPVEKSVGGKAQESRIWNSRMIQEKKLRWESGIEQSMLQKRTNKKVNTKESQRVGAKDKKERKEWEVHKRHEGKHTTDGEKNGKDRNRIQIYTGNPSCQNQLLIKLRQET